MMTSPICSSCSSSRCHAWDSTRRAPNRSAMRFGCSIGSHSALEVAYGARTQGLRNLVVTAKGREKTYSIYYARSTGPDRGCVDETIELVGLTDKRDAIASRMSGGQRRRLDVGLALIGNPELVFLDEPTTGFDPNARRAAWQRFRCKSCERATRGQSSYRRRGIRV